MTVGTSAAARVVLRLEGNDSSAAAAVEGKPAMPPAAAVTTASAKVAPEPADGDAPFRVPKGLWCYRLDRHRAVLGGALTDGGSAFEWLRSTLALHPGCDTDAVMREAEEMPPASHGLVVRLCL